MVSLADRYELAEPLGSGGMSRVVAAQDRLLGRRVAVKLLRDDLAADPVVRERLLREARAAASFAHPNAVAVYDVGEDAGRPFIVMELVEGRTLTDVLRKRGSLPTAEMLDIADGVLAALAAAHERGLVHRDVKPGNVLIAADGHVKLADFGIAKGLHEATAGLTATGQVIGTPRYLAPEQATGGTVDSRSDLYAAGVVCYEMLAGSPPFSGEHAVALAFAHQRKPVPPLADARPDVPAGLAAAVHRALEKDPAQRFGSAEEMRAALRAAADGSAETVVLPATAGTGAGAAGVVPVATTAGPDPAVTAGPGSRGRRSWWPAVALVAVAVLALVALSAALDGGQPAGEPPDGDLADGQALDPGADDAPADAGADPAPEPTPPPTPTPTPAPAVPAGEQLDALVEELDAAGGEDEEAFGEKTADLREDVADVLAEDDPQKQAEEARKLMNEIEKWVAEDELDPELGARTLALLEDFVREQREDGAGDR